MPPVYASNSLVTSIPQPIGPSLKMAAFINKAVATLPYELIFQWFQVAGA